MDEEGVMRRIRKKDEDQKEEIEEKKESEKKNRMK